MPNRAHSYRLKPQQFKSVMKLFNYSDRTVKALRLIFVDGKTYAAAGRPYGIKKQFLYPRVHRVLRCAKDLGYLS